MTVCFKMHSLSLWLIITLWITMLNKLFFQILYLSSIEVPVTIKNQNLKPKIIKKS